MIALALTVLLTVTGAVTVFLAGALSLTAPFIKLGGRGRPVEVEGGKVKGGEVKGGKVKGGEVEGKGGKAGATGKTGAGIGGTGLGTLAKGCLAATLFEALGFKGHVVLLVPADPHREQAPPPYWLMVTLNIYLNVIFFIYFSREASGRMDPFYQHSSHNLP